MAKNLQLQSEKMEKFSNSRVKWLQLGLFAFASLGLFILDLIFLASNPLHWILISTGLIISAIWWYWTMSLIRELIDQKKQEVEILSSLVKDIENIKQDVKKIKGSS